MGGSAMALTYLLKDMPAGVDPLGPENVLALFAERDHRRAGVGAEPR